jgi:hypothetical protein
MHTAIVCNIVTFSLAKVILESNTQKHRLLRYLPDIAALSYSFLSLLSSNRVAESLCLNITKQDCFVLVLAYKTELLTILVSLIFPNLTVEPKPDGEYQHPTGKHIVAKRKVPLVKHRDFTKP